MYNNYLFTSESVTEGHPDKMADQVADAILDALLMDDKYSRCAVEVLFKTGFCMIAGEISSNANINMPFIARKTICDIGYTSSVIGFDGMTCGVLISVEKQSYDIAKAVDISLSNKQGAGDQGIVFGYACNETKELMPMPIVYAHKLAHKLSIMRKNKILPWLRPDGKTQVTVNYENSKPVSINTIIISVQHEANILLSNIKEAIIEEIIYKTIPSYLLYKNIKYYINSSGSFVSGGPINDVGLTGRKIIIDSYGGMSRHGGGSFSGKDPSKLDRSGAYLARYIAKNIVAAGLAARCEVQLSYAMGLYNPISFMIETFGTAMCSISKLKNIIQNHFPLTPFEIIKNLNLLQPIYQSTSVYGHFGRENNNFSWENTDMIQFLQDNLL